MITFAAGMPYRARSASTSHASAATCAADGGSVVKWPSTTTPIAPWSGSSRRAAASASSSPARLAAAAPTFCSRVLPACAPIVDSGRAAHTTPSPSTTKWYPMSANPDTCTW